MIGSVPPSPWGPDDQAGAANRIGAGEVLRALRLAGEGAVLDLSHTISRDVPRMEFMSPYSMCMWSHPEVSRRDMAAEGAENGVAFADERVEMDLHTGTHVDGLGHCWVGGTGFNRRAVEDVAGSSGLRELGIEHLPPLLGRGVLLDVAALDGPLAPGEPVSVAHLQAASRSQQCDIEAGDIVLVRTGWGRFYDADPARYAGDAPGMGVEAAVWLGDRHPSAVGIDTIAFEVLPAEDAKWPWRVHEELLTRRGVYLIENAALEEAASRLRRPFLCGCFAIKFGGGTASPVRLVAVL